MLVATRRLVVLATVSLAACGGDRLTQPDASGGDARNVARNGGTPSDSTPVMPASVSASGRILGVTRVPPTSGGDSLRFEPIAGAAIQVHRNQLVNGAVQRVLVKALVADADGRYAIADLPGGYYIVTATPPAGSPYQENWSYMPATSAAVKVDVYLWRRQ